VEEEEKEAPEEKEEEEALEIQVDLLVSKQRKVNRLSL
jgi:hypothetical protein